MTGDLLIFLQGIGTVEPDRESGPPPIPRWPILRGLTLEMFAGQSLALLDPTGAGSTALRVLAGLLRPTAGVVFIEARDITDVPAHQRGFGVVLHDDPLPGPLRAIDVAGFPLLGRSLLARDRRRMASEMLQQAGLSGVGQWAVENLAPAEARRVALARGLVRAMLFTHPVLLLDEPLAGLDGPERHDLLDTLRQLQTRFGLTMITAQRDAAEARMLADRIAVLGHGRLEQVGEAGAIYAAPETLRAAQLLGETNLLSGTLEHVAAGHGTVVLAGGARLGARVPLPMRNGEPCVVQMRPEHVVVQMRPEHLVVQIRPEHVGFAPSPDMGDEGETGAAPITAHILGRRHMGDHVRLTCLVGETEQVFVRLPPGTDMDGWPHATVGLGWQPRHATAFPLP